MSDSQRARQRLGISRRHEHSGPAPGDQIAQPADVAGHDRKAGRHRLDRAVGKRLGPRGQDEGVRRREQRRHVFPMSQELDVRGQSARARQLFELATPRSVADDLKLQVRMGPQQHGRRGQQRLVALLAPQVGDGDDGPDRSGRLSFSERVQLEAVGNHHNGRCRDSLLLEHLARRLRIGGDLRGQIDRPAAGDESARRSCPG